jgi:predicted NBD/HSP70 family sugar kinase/antitoxin (DNA-binding transcriptional repressor) of toxin-antitoxin stability system
VETVAIRDLSGDFIARASEAGELLGVTNMGALVGVLVPLTRDVLQRMTARDAAQVRERLKRAEEELESGQSASTVSELLRDHAEAGHRQGPDRVSIRRLSGARIEQAAREGRTLIINSGQVALALLIPVTPDWLERWVESEINRFIDGGASGSKEASHPRGGSTPTEATDDLVQGPAVAMLTPRQEVLQPHANIGREVVWQRVIGIRVDADPAGDKGRLLGVVTDTAAKVLIGPVMRNLATIDESDVYNAVLTLVDDLKARVGPSESVIGIGLEMGGHVHDGQIIRSFNVHWEDFSLADRLNAVFGLPVVVENDANSLAILERRFHGVKEDNLAVILVTYRGVGCGLIIDGHLYRGSRGMAGELGHLPVGIHPSAHILERQAAQQISTTGDDLVRCRCGNPYCLESVATPHAIGQALETRDVNGGYEAAKRLMTTDIQVRSHFQYAGQALGRGVASVINLFNPSTVVFYGPPELLGGSREFHIDADLRRLAENHPYLAGVIEATSESQFSTGAFDCRFIVRRDADDQRARSAAACLINRLMPTSRILETRPVTVQALRPDISSPVTGDALAATIHRRVNDW